MRSRHCLFGSHRETIISPEHRQASQQESDIFSPYTNALVSSKERYSCSWLVLVFLQGDCDIPIARGDCFSLWDHLSNWSTSAGWQAKTRKETGDIRTVRAVQGDTWTIITRHCARLSRESPLWRQQFLFSPSSPGSTCQEKVPGKFSFFFLCLLCLRKTVESLPSERVTWAREALVD